MLKYLILSIFSWILINSASGQALNLSFESDSFSPWYLIGEHKNYNIVLDKSDFQHGNQSLKIESIKSNNSFGGLMIGIPHNIKGDSIEILGKFKFKDITKTSKMSFMLRIDPGVYFNNMQDANINGTADWKEYSIKAKLVPNKTTGIYLGVFLSGEGIMWADDIRIKVDGKELNQEMYTTYKKLEDVQVTSSGVKDFELTDQIHQNLVDLGKIWGLLKYRHPAIATGKIDWDAQLFKSIKDIISLKSNTEIDNYYSELLNSLGKVDKFPIIFSADKIAVPSDYAWIEKLPFSTALKEEFKNLQYSNFDKHHYFGFYEGVGNVEIKNEQAYKNIQDPDMGLRLLSLFRYWNIVQYFSPYRNLTDTKWDSILIEYIPKMIEAKSILAYHETVSGMLIEMKDAHTKLWSYSKPLNEKYGDKFLPFSVKIIEGKPVIVQLANSKGPHFDFKVGDIILTKNDRSLKDIQDSVYYILASPNQAVINREMGIQIAKSINEQDELVIVRDGKKLKVTSKTFDYSDLNFTKDTVAIKFLENGIAYINHGYVTEKYLVDNLALLQKSKGIVLDVRNYPREFLVFKLTPYLLAEAKEFVRFSYTSYAHLGEFKFSEPLKVGKVLPEYYKGKIAILMNEDTQSSAEYHIMAYRTAERAKVFGSQTAGADGNISRFSLPGGLSSMISGIGIYYPDGKETQRIGIVPDVKVEPTVKGIRKGRDEVLEKAIDYLLSK